MHSGGGDRAWFGKGKIHGAIGGSLRILGPKRDLCCGWPGANGDCDVQYYNTLGWLPVCRDSITPVRKYRYASRSHASNAMRKQCHEWALVPSLVTLHLVLI